MPAFEPFTRQDFSLETANGDYFDQIVGMSQGTINKNFETVFNNNRSFRVINWDIGSGVRLKADLDPPQLILNVTKRTDTNRAYWIIRFKSGKLETDSPTYMTYRLDGWQVALEVDLNTLTLREAGGGGETNEKFKDDLKVLERYYTVPGDYSIERLYAALSNAAWGRLDGKLTFCGFKPDGAKKSYSDWQAEVATVADAYRMAIEKWAGLQESKGLTAVGYRFKMPEYASNRPLPTFTPFNLINQTYQYRSNAETEPVVGLDGGSQYNSFLWCETVDRRPLPTNVALGWTGNLSMAKGSNPQGQDVDGTFIIHPKCIMTNFFLRHLQPLCQAVELIISQPDRLYDPVTQDAVFNPNYSLGCQPLGTPPDQRRKSSDKYFEFQPLSDLKYQWKKQSAHPPGNADPEVYEIKNPHDNTTVRFSRHKISAEAQVIVECKAGSSVVQISGETVYHFSLEFASDKEMRLEHSEKKYTTRLPWSFDLSLGPAETGIMGVSVQGVEKFTPVNLATLAKVEAEKNDRIAGNTKDRMLTYLKENFAKNLSIIFDNLKAGLNPLGKFTYPGSGTLLFGSPLWNKKGNLFCNVTYAPLKDEPITIPDPRETPPKPTPDPPPKNSDEPIAPPGEKLRLSWSSKATHDAASGLTTFTITIRNGTPKNAYCKYLQIVLLVNKQFKSLLGDTDYQETSLTAPAKSGTFYWKASPSIDNMITKPESPPPNYVLRFAFKLPDSSKKDRPASFVIPSAGEISATFTGTGELGLHKFTAREAHMDPEAEPDEGAEYGFEVLTCEVVPATPAREEKEKVTSNGDPSLPTKTPVAQPVAPHPPVQNNGLSTETTALQQPSQNTPPVTETRPAPVVKGSAPTVPPVKTGFEHL